MENSASDRLPRPPLDLRLRDDSERLSWAGESWGSLLALLPFCALAAAALYDSMFGILFVIVIGGRALMVYRSIQTVLRGTVVLGEVRSVAPANASRLAQVDITFTQGASEMHVRHELLTDEPERLLGAALSVVIPRDSRASPIVLIPPEMRFVEGPSSHYHP